MTTAAERSRRYRDRKRGTPPRQVQPCGTRAAYERHKRRGESPCAACMAAHAAHQREMYAKRKR